MPTTNDTLVCHDVYLRHTDEHGRSHIREHRVWDSARFIQAQAKAAAEAGGKAKLELTTRHAYLQQQNAKR